MPLRALLLLPSSEQPTALSTTASNSATHISSSSSAPKKPSPLNISSTKLSTALGALSPRPEHGGETQSALATDAEGNGDKAVDNSGLEEDILTGRTDLGWPFDTELSKPPPSPRLDSKDVTSNRSSNQTYQTTLTLPSVSGSSHTSSVHSSPPLSPGLLPTSSPTTTTSSRASNGNPVSRSKASIDPSNSVKTLVAPVSLPVKRDARGRPMLKLTTKLPKVGSGLSYHPYESSTPRPVSLLPVVDSPIDIAYSDSDEEDGLLGEGLEREAVEERLHHLLAASTPGLLAPSSSSRPSSPTPDRKGSGFVPLSPSQIAFSPGNSRQGSKIIEGLEKRVSQLSTLSISQKSVAPLKTHHHHPAKRKPTRRSSRKHTRVTCPPIHAVPTKPPPPPTKGIAPFKILSDSDYLDLLGEEGIRILAEGRKVSVGWKQKNLSTLRQGTYPKGTKGRYIRLITLPPLPPPVPTVSLSGDDFDEPSILTAAPTSRKGKGRMPTVLIHDDVVGEEPSKEKEEILTVFMTELVEREHKEPVACWVHPKLDISSLKRLAPSPPPPSIVASSTSTIYSLPAKAHLFPLPHLSRTQFQSLQALGLLVYAVPSSYQGPVPPVIVPDDEIVAPWASGSRVGSSLLSGNKKGGNRDSTLSVTSVGSPLRAGFGINGPVSPLRLAFGGGQKDLTTSALSVGKEDNRRLAPDTASAGKGRWNGWSRRTSASSFKSDLSIPEENFDHEERSTSPTPKKANDTDPSVAATGGWSSTIGSLKARAQEYYASKSTSASPSTSVVSLEPADEPSNTTLSSAGAVKPLAMRKTDGPDPGSEPAPANTAPSRSFGSFFTRGSSTTPQTSSTGTENAGSPSLFNSFSAPSLSGSSATASKAPSTVITPDEDEVLRELREAGIVVKNLDADGDESVLISTPAKTSQPAETTGSKWKWGRWGA